MQSRVPAGAKSWFKSLQVSVQLTGAPHSVMVSVVKLILSVVSATYAPGLFLSVTSMSWCAYLSTGSHIRLGPLYGSAPHSPVCNREVEVKEKNGVLRVMLVRMNGLQERAGVICSTTAVTKGATADEDFVGRPRNTSSVVHFDAASSIAYCPVRILDDRRLEPREKFVITLSSAGGPSHIVPEVSTLCVYITSDDGKYGTHPCRSCTQLSHCAV